MKIEVIQTGGVTQIKVTGRLDTTHAPAFEKKFDQVLEQGFTNLMVDMKDVDFISSAGLRSLLVIGRKIHAANGHLFLSNLGGQVQEVFDVSGLSSWILQDGQWKPEE